MSGELFAEISDCSRLLSAQVQKMNPHVILFLLAAAATGLALAGTAYVFSLAIVGFLGPSKSADTATEPPRNRFLILIPAHDEEQGIGPTLESLRAQNYPNEMRRVLVIADNCGDRTAAVVRRAGFECWERADLAAPGKGQALRWALDRLAPDSSDAVAFVDADTRVHPDFLGAMDRAMQKGAVAIQGSYEFELADSGPFSLLTFASKRAENTLFWRPRERFGLMGFIVGNGFCLKREVFDTVPWAAYSIVEDVEYAIQLALHGIRVRFLESARVVSRSTHTSTDAAPQRLRWASGTFQVIWKFVPQLLRAGVRKGSIRLCEMAVATALTSRFLLVYLLAVASVFCFIARTSGSSLAPTIGVAAAVLLLCGYVGMVLSQIPNEQGTRFRALLGLPFYLCWMLFVHAAAAVGMRRNAWVRTTR